MYIVVLCFCIFYLSFVFFQFGLGSYKNYSNYLILKLKFSLICFVFGRLNKYVIKVVNKIVVKIELRKLIVYCYFVFFVEIEELLKNYLIIINNIFLKELILIVCYVRFLRIFV